MPNPSTDLLTRFVEVAPKEWKGWELRPNGVFFRAGFLPKPICLDDDGVSAGALILLLDKLEEAGYLTSVSTITIANVEDQYECEAWGNDRAYEQRGATRIEAVVKAYVEVMEK